MKPILLFSIVLVLAVSVFSPQPADAAKGGKKLKPTPVPEKVNASGSKITSVSGDSITIEYSKTSTTYKMSNETSITLEDKKVRSTDLKPGMHAEITASSINPKLLLSIRAHAETKK